MKVLLVNPPYQTLTSNLGVGHQVPLGLLMVGGGLRDVGHEVRLVDAEARHLSNERVAACAAEWGAEVVMSGHAGSTPAHLVCMAMFGAIRRASPRAVSVYGGVFPTYHAESILREHAAVDVVVRGEGEATVVELVGALAERGVLRDVAGITYREGERVVRNEDRAPIADLDRFRTGWELIENWDLYTCFGLGRSAIVQFSRGCPHRCTYCGQHGFWVKWRHRDPVRVAEEIARLRHEHDVRFITLADENPTTLKREWKRLLEEIAARKLGVHFFATIRATDVVRDADILPLYREAGLLYVLLGIDATDPTLIEQINKRSTMRQDGQACGLLRDHGIRTIIGHIVGLGNETWADFRRARRVLDAYDGDLLNAMFATPHSWTRFARDSAERPVVQEEQGLWDYRHQVLGQATMKPWQLFLAVKWLELAHHAQWKRMVRMFRHPDRTLRGQFRWTALHTGLVWLGEIVEFVVRTRFARRPRRLGEWMGRYAAHASSEVLPSAVRLTVSAGHVERRAGARAGAAR